MIWDTLSLYPWAPRNISKKRDANQARFNQLCDFRDAISGAML
jgi:hypothetical protein